MAIDVSFKGQLGHIDAANVKLRVTPRFWIFTGVNNIGKSKLVRSLMREMAAFASTSSSLTDIIMSGNNHRDLIKAVESDSSLMQSLSLNPGAFENAVLQSMPYSERAKFIDSDVNRFQIELNRGYIIINTGGFNKRIRLAGFGVYESMLGIKHRFDTVTVDSERDVKAGPAWTDQKYLPDGSTVSSGFEKVLGTTLGNHELGLQFIEHLNSITEPDFVFDRLLLQRDPETNQFGPALHREGRTDQVSDVGSGIRSLVHILFCLHIYEHVWPTGSRFGFLCIDEIEASLHPGVLRRLLDHLARVATEKDFRVVLVTHSPVVIEHMARNHETAVHKVFKDEGGSLNCNIVEGFESLLGTINTLGARPSDLLQSNFVIWVEGPTELVVVEHWLKLMDPKLILGTHYVLACYAGRLLARYNTNREVVVNDQVNVASINSSFAFIMDHDIADSNDPEKFTPGKTKLLAWAKEQNFEVMITEGREIEDYYPSEVYEKVLGPPTDEQWAENREKNWGFKKTVEKGWGKGNQERHKIDLANAYVSIVDSLDVSLKNQLRPIVAAVHKANGMKEPTE